MHFVEGIESKEVVIASNPLVDGVYDTMYFTVEDLAGNSRQSAGELSITIDTLPPQRPTVDLQSTSDSGLSDTDNITKFESLQFRVASEPGTTLYVKDGNTVVYEIISDGDNLLTLNLPQGSHLISAESIDDAGNRSAQSEELLVVVDTTAPSIAIPDLQAFSDTGIYDDDEITNKMQPSFTGTTERDAKVRLRADGIVAAEGVAARDGRWEVTSTPLDDGVYEITIEAEDLAGNVSGISETLKIEIDTLAPNTPLLDLVEADDSGRHNDDNITNVNKPLLSATTTDPNANSHMTQWVTALPAI